MAAVVQGSEMAAVVHGSKMAADGRLVCSSDDDHDALSKTESCSLNPEVCEVEYLHFNGDQLLWSNDLYSLKNFVVNVLKLQGKWLTLGGNTKQFKSSNGNVIINFQGRDGPALRDKLVELVRKKPGTSTDLQVPEPLVSTEQTMQPSLSEEANSCHRNSRILIDDGSPPNCTQERPNPEIVTDIEALKLDLLVLQKHVNVCSLTLTNLEFSCTTLKLIHFFFIRIYFIRISRLKFAKF